jgi:AcrR family transcriptional regulator
MVRMPVGRDRILDAAERLFIERGFTGVSIGDIAAEVGVGKSLVMHHGGSKAALWDAVKRRLFDTYGEGQLRMLEDRPASTELLVDSLRSYFAWLQAHPGFLRLMAWRDLEIGTALSGPEARLLELGRQRMREARDAGQLSSAVDPDLALFAVFAMLEAWFLSGKRACFPGRDDPAADGRYLDNVLALLRHGLIAREAMP